MESLSGVGGSDRGDLDRITGLDHHTVADHHGDVAIPHREVTRHHRSLIDLDAHALLLGKARDIDAGLPVGPLGQAAAVQADAGLGAAPLIGHTHLAERFAHGFGGGGIRSLAGAAVREEQLHALAHAARVEQHLGRAGVGAA